MTGETSIYGIFVPTLLLLAVAALILTSLVMQGLSYIGAYRFVAYRALVDLCLFIVILGLLVWVTQGTNS